MSKKRGTQHLKRKQPAEGVEALFEGLTRKQLISFIIVQDAVIGLRNSVLADPAVAAVLTEEHHLKLSSIPHETLIDPAAIQLVQDATAEAADEDPGRVTRVASVSTGFTDEPAES